MNIIETKNGYENGRAAWEDIQDWLLAHWIRKTPQHRDELETISDMIKLMWRNTNGPTIDILSKGMIMAINSDAEGVKIVAHKAGKAFRIKLSDEPVTTGLDTLRTMLRELDSGPTMFMII